MVALTTSAMGSPKLSVTVESLMERTETSLKGGGVGVVVTWHHAKCAWICIGGEGTALEYLGKKFVGGF